MSWTSPPLPSARTAPASSYPARLYQAKTLVRRASWTRCESEACSMARNGPTSLPPAADERHDGRRGEQREVAGEREGDPGQRHQRSTEPQHRASPHAVGRTRDQQRDRRVAGEGEREEDADLATPVKPSSARYSTKHDRQESIAEHAQDARAEEQDDVRAGIHARLRGRAVQRGPPPLPSPLMTWPADSGRMREHERDDRGARLEPSDGRERLP